MKLKTIKYLEQEHNSWPQEGQHILAQYNEEEIVVYQSYRPAIGDFARGNQFFGGPFSLNRMTWIKPNFLWMMYRNGWGTKEGQEVVLAIHLKRDFFEEVLAQAAYSSYKSNVYESQEAWRNHMSQANVRLQWDPDHYPNGEKHTRRAIQLGLKNEMIAEYAKDAIIEIEDISKFVAEQYEHVKTNDLKQLITPEEHVYIPKDKKAIRFLGLDV